MSRPDFMFPLTKEMKRTARQLDGEGVDPTALKPGDKFSFFMNMGSDVGVAVYIFDDRDGFAYHEEETGIEGNLTGEVPVVRWLVPQIRFPAP